MGKCYIEISGSPPELLYEDVRDSKGNSIETTYHNETLVQSVWEQMSDNISRTLREILIQKPELIPIVNEIMEKNKKNFPDTLTLEDNE